MSPTPPPLTVALPTYNGARFVAEALRGILDQRDVTFDLLVCDDQSEDRTVEVVRQVAGDRARIEINPERLGLAGNWNRCAELSRTPILAIVHQDDVMRPGHLAAHLRAFERAPTLGMVCGATEIVDESSQPLPKSVIKPASLGQEDRFYPPGAFVAELAEGNPVRCSAVTLSAEALASVGGFDPSYRYVVDWDCWLRIAQSWPVFWTARPSVAVRWHSSSETSRFRSGTEDLEEVSQLLEEVHRKAAQALPSPAQARRRARRSLGRAYLNRALDTLHAGNAPLALACLHRALSKSPSVLGRIARDPRLAGQMTTLVVAPAWAARQFSKNAAREAEPPSDPPENTSKPAGKPCQGPPAY